MIDNQSAMAHDGKVPGERSSSVLTFLSSPTAYTESGIDSKEQADHQTVYSVQTRHAQRSRKRNCILGLPP